MNAARDNRIKTFLLGTQLRLITSITIQCVLLLEFKKNLYNYYLEYTRNLITTIVNARNGSVELTDLRDLVSNHTAGNYSDEDVSFLKEFLWDN